MYSALCQKGIFFILFYCTLLNSTITSEQEVESPKTILGVVESYKPKKDRTGYLVDARARQEVPLHNLRGMKEPPDLNTYGFTYVSERHMQGMDNLEGLNQEELITKHQAALKADSVKLVQKLTHSPLAISYSEQFRQHDGTPKKEAISMIHSDLSPKGAKFIKHQLQKEFLESEDPEERNFGKHLSEGGHDVVMYNVWRPLKKVEDNPLALCDWRTVSEQDRKKIRIKLSNLENTIQVWDYNRHQNWFFLPMQEPHEVYVFIQHDSRAKDRYGISVPHASFFLTTDDEIKPQRMSFECRVIALFPKTPKAGKLEKVRQQFKSVFSQNILGKKKTAVNN